MGCCSPPCVMLKCTHCHDREVGAGEKATVAARRYAHETVHSINNHYNTIEILIKREQRGWSSMLILIFNWCLMSYFFGKNDM